jgi:hypothetical protein
MNLLLQPVLRCRSRIGQMAGRGPGRISALLGLAVLLGGAAPVSAAPEATPSQVKAAFLLNFPRYVEWPAAVFATSNSPIVVTILGDATLEEEFSKMAAGKTINGRPVVVLTQTAPDQLKATNQIVFVSASVRQSADLLARLRAAPILTVGDGDDFLAQGGAIRFARRDQRIRLEVNLVATQQAQLKVSSKLLGVADVVKGSQ